MFLAAYASMPLFSIRKIKQISRRSFLTYKNLEVKRNFLTPISNIENSLFDNKFFFSNNRNVLRRLLRKSILSNQTLTISKLTFLAYILPLPKQIFLKQSASHMKMLVWIRRFYECCTMLLDKKTVWRQFSEMEIYPKVFIKSKLGELIFNLDPYFDGKHFSSLTFCICSFSGKTPLLHLQWSWNPLPLGRWGQFYEVLSDLKFLPTPGSPQANVVLKYFTFWGHNRVFLYWGIGLMGERSPPLYLG